MSLPIRVVVFCLLPAVPLGASDAPPQSSGQLVNLGLEDLMNLRVTTVSRRSERLADAAASIFVITAEDIRRSGARSLPEALRLAPNLHVARASASGDAISARGFNNSAANKLLVLIDGRSVYTPLFSGVFWDAQDVMIENIDRIEVISGPGGTMWGTNAVNGVINIITKSASEAQGTLVTAGAGNGGWETAVRHGGTFGANAEYRVMGKHFAESHTETAAGVAKTDAWRKSQGGFRIDWKSPRDQLSVFGSAYNGRAGQPLPGTISITGVNLALDTIAISGGNLSTRWERTLGEESNFTVHADYDRTRRVVPPTFAETLDIGDVQARHLLAPIGRHVLAWGAEYRQSRDRVVNSNYIAFLPARLTQRWTSLFAQDDISLQKNLKLTAGARLERNSYTGNEFLPTIRMAWKPADDRLLWAAASRTVRAPSRLDRDTFVPGHPPFLLAGGPLVRSEIANVYELGYRGAYGRTVSYSATVFHTDYDHLRTQEIAPSRTFLFFANGMEGTTSGIEAWASMQPARFWRLNAGFIALREKLRLKPGSNDVTGPAAQEGRDPKQSWIVSSSFDLPRESEFDVHVRHVSSLTTPFVPSYTAVDARFGWRPRRNLDVSLTLQNLTDPGHGEFNAVSTRTEIRRSWFLELSLGL